MSAPIFFPDVLLLFHVRYEAIFRRCFIVIITVMKTQTRSALEWSLLQVAQPPCPGGAKVKVRTSERVSSRLDRCVTCRWRWSEIQLRDVGRCVNGVCLTHEATEYFIHQLCEADWFAKTRDGRCGLKLGPPLFASVKLGQVRRGRIKTWCLRTRQWGDNVDLSERNRM